MKRGGGFTLIEVLVASLLLSMLVMILTMVFNQSSIAWRTGKASVAKMDQVRRRLAVATKQADDMLPGVSPNSGSEVGMVVSAWKESSSGSTLRQRGVATIATVGSSELSVSAVDPAKSDKAWQLTQNMTQDGLGKVDAYVVGVWSYGKNGEPGDDDDITTWPDDMD